MSSSLVRVTDLARLSAEGGDVLHALKSSEDDFSEFGEAYFSEVRFGAIKAWKMHERMTLNLVVPFGSVRFVFFDAQQLAFQEITLESTRHARLNVKPGVWFGFKGLADPISIVLNIADIEHAPDEVQRKPLSAISYDWTQE